MEKLGATICTVQADISSQEQVAKLIDHIQDLPLLKGVIHAADLKEEVAQVLGLQSVQIGNQDTLNDMRIDSLMAVKFRNRIMTYLSVDIPIEELIKGATVQKLTKLIPRSLTPRSEQTV